MATTTAKPSPGRPAKPAALKRTEWLKLRLSTLEKEALAARAEAAGLDVSSYVRLQACGAAPEQTARRRQEVERAAKAEQRAPGDLEAIMQRIRAEQPGLPENSVRILARRQMARR